MRIHPHGAPKAPLSRAQRAIDALGLLATSLLIAITLGGLGNILDSEAVGPLSAVATDKYGEAVPANFSWETDEQIGAEGSVRLVLPPRVAMAIYRQRDAVIRIGRKARGRQRWEDMPEEQREAAVARLKGGKRRKP